jgi:hypothetical protein
VDHFEKSRRDVQSVKFGQPSRQRNWVRAVALITLTLFVLFLLLRRGRLW